MKKRISIMAVVIAVAALAAAPLVLAGPHGGKFRGYGFGGGMALLGHLQHAKEELDLSDQQLEQIKSIMAEVHEQNAPYREQMHGGIKGVVQTLLADPNNVSAAQTMIDQQSAAERAIKTNILHGTARAVGVLTVEQRQKLGTMVEKFAERHAERRRR